MAIATFPLGPLGTNCYVVDNNGQALVIDVGGDPAPVLAYLREHNLTLTAILITHRHFDHLYGVADLARTTGAPVFVSAGDDELAKTEASKGGIWGMPPVQPFDAQELKPGKNTFAGLECLVLETPGHTPGGVSLYFPELNAVFTGDTLFYRSLGRTDFPLGDHKLLLKSIHEQLFTLPDDVTAYPGHGPATTIGAERRENPFCGEFAV